MNSIPFKLFDNKNVKSSNTSRVEQMESIQKEGLELFRKKNQDYGDAFASYGVVGVLVRMGDKISRLQSITNKCVSLIDSESLRDTLIDLHNYSAMAIMLLDEDKKIKEVKEVKKIKEVKEVEEVEEGKEVKEKKLCSVIIDNSEEIFSPPLLRKSMFFKKTESLVRASSDNSIDSKVASPTSTSPILTSSRSSSPPPPPPTPK